jgi:glycosyltransferase involved in cell wall biosynthesis
MACQTPVVATARAVSALQAQPGQDVLVADEPADLAEHFINLLENFDYRQEIAKNGLRYVRMNHDWKMIVNQLQNIYEDVISHHSKSKHAG